MSKVALVSAPCESFGHPYTCTEPATGTVITDNADTNVDINGRPVANHNSSMYFSNHGHDVSPSGACTDYQTHYLVPSDVGGISINGKRVMQKGDTQIDPGSGGTATIIGTGRSHSHSVMIHD